MHIDDKLADMYSLHVADNRLVDEPIITEDMAQHLVPSQCCSTCRPLRRKLQDSFVRMQNGARLEPQQAQQAGKILASSRKLADGLTSCTTCRWYLLGAA